MISHAEDYAAGMISRAAGLVQRVKSMGDKHPAVRDFITKLGADNIGLLAGFVSWSILTSLIPLAVGIVALSGLFIQDPSTQQAVVQRLSEAMQGAVSSHDIQTMVEATTSKTGLLAVVAFVGIFWGSSNVGGSIATACQAVFEVSGRPFWKEKLIDLGMLIILTVTVLLVVGGSLASAYLNTLLGASLPGIIQFLIGACISFAAAFVLFVSIYSVFPNIEAAYKRGHVWRGALVAAAMLVVVSYIWPIYVRISQFSRYGAFFFSVIVLTTWIYFFSMILMVGAEFVAVPAIREAQRRGESVGPLPERTVPQHLVLRRGRRRPTRNSASDGHAPAVRAQIPLASDDPTRPG